MWKKELRETESWCRRYFEETGQKVELFCFVCWEELKDKDLIYCAGCGDAGT